jgi:poly(ADP-ribose) glycohydrolase ARH3
MLGLLDRFQGCLLGLALGDALCADREGGLPERLLWLLLGRTRQGLRRWTDDTQMTVDLAAHLAREGRIDQDRLAADFAGSYRWSRGYGPSTAAVLKKIRSGWSWQEAARARHPAGSFGNGAAMRVAPAALFWHDQPVLLAMAAEQASVVTHPHPAAVKGAKLVAQAIASSLRGLSPLETAELLLKSSTASDYAEPMQTVRGLLAAADLPEPAALQRVLGLGIAAVKSCPAALLIGLRLRDRPFAELLAYVRSCAGDTDTVAAMAGAVWGAANGYGLLPEPLLRSVEAHEEIRCLSATLHSRYLQQRRRAVWSCPRRVSTTHSPE